MSIRLMNAILDDDSITDPTETLLLLALADHANDDGVCWPSIDRLAQRARVSERQAQRLISKLIDDGRLQADRRGGRNRSTIYRLVITKGDARVTVSPQNGDIHDVKRVTSTTKRVTSTTQKGDTHVTPTTNEPPIEPSGEPPIVGGVGEVGKPLQNGGEGETADAAQEPDAAAIDLPAEVRAAWDVGRWPLTDRLCKFLCNAEQAYSRGELLTAIEIMQSSPKEIDRPAAYLKKVLQRRMSAIADRAPVTAERWREIDRQYSSYRVEPKTAACKPSPFHVAELNSITVDQVMSASERAEADLVRSLLAEQTLRDTRAWGVAVDGDHVWLDAAELNEWLGVARPRLERVLCDGLRRPVKLALEGVTQ